MKKFFIPLFFIISLASFYLFVQAKTLTIKGRVVDLITGQGVGGITITGTNVPTGVLTDATNGKFSFVLTNPTDAPSLAFTINTPATPTGFNALYAQENNITNFWETDYKDQVAGIRCRSEKAFCTESGTVFQVLRDKGSSSRYNFVAEPAVSCTTQGTQTPISNPAMTPAVTMSNPAVATDGSRALLAAQGSDTNLWVNTSTNIAGNKWSGWVNVGNPGGGVGVTSPAPRALVRNKFAIFFGGTTKHGILRDAKNSKTPFIQITDAAFSFTPRDKIEFKTVKYQFSINQTSQAVQFSTCT